MDTAEKRLRELWDAKGVPKPRQDEIIASITAAAQPGASIGPFTIPGGTSAEFPYPCTRCGVCCLLQRCPVILAYCGGENRARCEEVKFTGDEAECGLVRRGIVNPQTIGAGKGCCISARVACGFFGEMKDVASLDAATKIQLAHSLRARQVKVIHNAK